MNHQTNQTPFTKALIDFFWPIKKAELPFFLPMALMMMCALYNFASLRTIKDSLVVSNIGPESISFLKLWLVLPSAILFTLIYLRLSNKYSFEKVFYIVTSGFLAFFAIFCFILYPNQEQLHISSHLINDMTLNMPYFKWFIHILGKWTYALLYIFAELWSVVIINLMFWQFANSVVSTQDAKRFYPLFGFIGNLGLVIAGNAMIFFAGLSNSQTGGNQADQTLGIRLGIASVILSGLIMMFLMVYLRKYTSQVIVSKPSSTSKTKLSIIDSIKLIFNSKHIRYITAIIICYSLAINIIEGPWKAKIKELYQNQNDYMAFMGRFNIWMGVICVSFMIIGSNFVRLFSWTASALFTPIVIGATGIAFFAFVIFDHFNNSFDHFWLSPLFAAVIAGSMQNILSKASKYSLFDATKEMAYIPLSTELRTKGKAAAEVVGAKFGKSLGAIIQASMFTFLPNASFNDLTPVLLIFFLIVICIWIISVASLSKSYNQISKY